MTRLLWVTAAAVGFSLLIAVLLHWKSADYRYEPARERRIAAPAAEPPPELPPTGPPSREVLELLRSSGSTAPGDVEVQAICLNPLLDGRIPEGLLAFQLVFNTASVDLTALDIPRKVRLEDGKGRGISSGWEWRITHTAGFHPLAGVLVAPDLKGERSLRGGDGQWLKLILRGIPKVKYREFVWMRS